ncbi:hypothetical protein FA95DRAFT_1604939 [Auriscalpium vulgare]|uniref:Uncharacterized protein n=1 Tax=Auriscalpium vulgare TaxID=40419 RepID=A0ACB8RYE8_9AGAM|nr:hypothetical protein FA95DRAFT_1604939 [Auriscalpium vulgare]
MHFVRFWPDIPTAGLESCPKIQIHMALAFQIHRDLRHISLAEGFATFDQNED